MTFREANSFAFGMFEAQHRQISACLIDVKVKPIATKKQCFLQLRSLRIMPPRFSIYESILTIETLFSSQK